MTRGTVTWFNNELGFGFIKPDDGGVEVFVLQRLIRPLDEDPFEIGEPVEFDIHSGALSPYAINIRRSRAEIGVSSVEQNEEYPSN